MTLRTSLQCGPRGSTVGVGPLGFTSVIDERLELDEEARVEQRRQDIAQQTSEPNGPGVRIRAWEKVHALRMPSSPEHPVLNLIAAATQLSLADVHDEQRVRSRHVTAVITG